MSECQHCGHGKPDAVKFYYMFDNHTFARLHGTLDAMIAEAARLERHGMLCSPILLCGDKEVRRAGISIHNAPHHDWQSDAIKWKTACEADADVMRLLGAKP